MTFQLIRGTASYYNDPVWPHQPYLVEKVFKPGETYTIGTFLTKAAALKCLNSLRASEEVRRGALVTEAL